jgi:hypothetical protein
MSAGQAAVADDRVAVHLHQPGGGADAVALGQVLQHRQGLLLGQLRSEQGRPLALGEPRLAQVGCGKYSWHQPRGLAKMGKALFHGVLAMQATPKLSRDEFITRMREKMEATLGQVADAINQAAPGQIIAGSEERVRDLFADLRQHAYQTGVQMRLDAAEAAFPPSEGPEHGPEETQ